MEVDFRGEFKKYDVMTEIGVDPGLLSDLKSLRLSLEQRIHDQALPLLGQGSKDMRSKAKKIDASVSSMNEKQLIDTLIEVLIESKCKQPSFIMNHPLIMSPLAKSHAQGRFSNGGSGVPKETIVDSAAAPYLSERFELFVNHMEVINSYSE